MSQRTDHPKSDLVQRLKTHEAFVGHAEQDLSCETGCIGCDVGEAADRITELERRLAAAEKVCGAARSVMAERGDGAATVLEGRLLFVLAEWERDRNG